MGRFISEDTDEGEIEDPLSLNLYAYCSGNPIMYTDPSGHDPGVFKDEDGLYEFMPDLKFYNIIYDSFGVLPFGDIAIKYINSKITGVEPIKITKKDILSVLCNKLSIPSTALSQVNKLGKFKKLPTCIKCAGEAASVVSTLITLTTIGSDVADDSPEINQIVFELYCVDLESKTKEGVIGKYAIYAALVRAGVKNGSITYQTDLLGDVDLSSLKVNWNKYDKTAEELHVDAKLKQLMKRLYH